MALAPLGTRAAARGPAHVVAIVRRDLRPPGLDLEQARARLRELGYLQGRVERFFLKRALEGRGGLLFPAIVAGALGAALASVAAAEAADGVFRGNLLAALVLLTHLTAAYLLPASILGWLAGRMAERSRSPAVAAAAVGLAAAAAVLVLFAAGTYSLAARGGPSAPAWAVLSLAAALLIGSTARSAFLALAYARTGALPGRRPGRAAGLALLLVALAGAGLVLPSRRAPENPPAPLPSPRAQPLLVLAIDGLALDDPRGGSGNGAPPGPPGDRGNRLVARPGQIAPGDMDRSGHRRRSGTPRGTGAGSSPARRFPCGRAAPGGKPLVPPGCRPDPAARFERARLRCGTTRPGVLGGDCLRRPPVGVRGMVGVGGMARCPRRGQSRAVARGADGLDADGRLSRGCRPPAGDRWRRPTCRPGHPQGDPQRRRIALERSDRFSPVRSRARSRARSFSWSSQRTATLGPGPWADGRVRSPRASHRADRPADVAPSLLARRACRRRGICRAPRGGALRARTLETLTVATYGPASRRSPGAGGDGPEYLERLKSLGYLH